LERGYKKWGVVKKPLSYFSPPYLITDIPDNSLNPKEHELITYFRKIYDEDLENATITIVKTISQYIPVDVHTGKINKAIEDDNPQEFINLLLNRKSKKNE
jgi:hypothetical protein